MSPAVNHVSLPDTHASSLFVFSSCGPLCLQLYTLGLKEKNATAEHWVKRADLHYRLEQS